MLDEAIWLIEQEHISRSEAESLVASVYEAAYPEYAVRSDSLKMVQRATARRFAEQLGARCG
jgi:hypothetical protein